MRISFLCCVITLVWCWQVVPLQAQDAPGRVRIELRDGSVLFGTIVAEDEGQIHFRTDAGVEMTLSEDQIRAVEEMPGAGGAGRFLRADPNRTRLLFAPTARSLRSGEGYVAVYEIFFPFVSVGLADRAILSGGVSLLPGVSEQLLYAAPKLSLVQRDGLALAAGAFLGTVTGGEGTGGLVYGVGTLGGSEKALTLGLGFAFGGGEFTETPALLVGGEYQLSDNVKLLSENYVIPEAEGVVLLSGGIRFMGERLAADFGLFTSPEVINEGGFPFFPWLGFAYNFGRRRLD